MRHAPIEARHRRLAAATALVALVGLVAACSSNKSPDDSALTPTESPAAETVAAPADAQAAVAAPSPAVIDRPVPTSLAPGSVAGSGGAGDVVAVPEAPAPSLPDRDGVPGPKQLEDAAGAVLLDGCGVAGLPFVALGLALGIAGVPLPADLPAVMPALTPVCTAMGFPDHQTVCPNDRPGGVALAPPPQGRIIDLIDGAENEAAAAGAPDNGVALTLRAQLGCEQVAYP